MSDEPTKYRPPKGPFSPGWVRPRISNPDPCGPPLNRPWNRQNITPKYHMPDKGNYDVGPRDGRDTLYRDSFVAAAQKLCAGGMTDYQIADFFEVSTQTLTRWRCTYPEFNDAFKVGREYATERVKRAVYHRAVGYEVEAVKVFQYKGEIISETIREHIPPSDNAGQFWLRNKAPEEFADKGHEPHRVEVVIPNGVPGMTAAEKESSVREFIESRITLIAERREAASHIGNDDGGSAPNDEV